MQMITTIGLDIAKSVFQAHGIDAAGQVVKPWMAKSRSGALPASKSSEKKSTKFVTAFSELPELLHCLLSIETPRSLLPSRVDARTREPRNRASPAYRKELSPEWRELVSSVFTCVHGQIRNLSLTRHRLAFRKPRRDQAGSSEY